ncbi:MAG: DNA repair protein RecN [Lentisphaerae bacterium]|nr:DNA repair protein RecN [Lentisphaerota bacterium]
MLEHLHILHYALVDDLRVEFGDGLNIVTGETGAGKTVLMGALGFALGERADRSMIRDGEESCSVEAAFQLPDPAGVNGVLEETGLDVCAEGRLVLRRTLAQSGSGKIFINDRAATQQTVKRIGDLLVDMHGPHDHQSLLKPEFQIELLDAFGRLGADRQAYAGVYGQIEALRKRRSELELNDKDVAREADMLKFQIKEIKDAEPREGEDAEIANEHRLLGNAQEILGQMQAAQDALTDGELSAFSRLVLVQQALAAVGALAAEAEGWRGEAKELAGRIQELGRAMAGLAHKLEADPARLQWLDERLAVYRKLKRKYGESVAGILRFLEDSEKRLHDLENREQQLAEIDKDLAKVNALLREAGGTLGGKRRRVAKKLAAALETALKGLGFAQSAFAVDVKDVEPSPTGMNEVDFQFAPNPGEAPRPLRAIASSGEISRVMLALKSVFAGHDRIPVLVFDEIDVNIGGETAGAVGLKLAEIADGHQVICITHLPQVAVHGRRHLAVAKEVKGGRTFTRLAALDKDGRVEEIARMLGGKNLTSVTADHAAEMLKKAERKTERGKIGR